MAAEQQPYKRLPGKGRTLFSVAVAASYRLYLGSDHILHVANERFSERYKRFYFRDIQALVLSRSDRQNTINVVLIIAAAAGALLSWGIGSAGGAAVGWGAATLFGIFFGILFALNLGRGPTCVCHVQTAVHTFELTSLRRVRTARKVFAILQPLIAEAQAGVATVEAAPGNPDP